MLNSRPPTKEGRESADTALSPRERRHCPAVPAARRRPVPVISCRRVRRDQDRAPTHPPQNPSGQTALSRGSLTQPCAPANSSFDCAQKMPRHAADIFPTGTAAGSGVRCSSANRPAASPYRPSAQPRPPMKAGSPRRVSAPALPDWVRCLSPRSAQSQGVPCLPVACAGPGPLAPSARSRRRRSTAYKSAGPGKVR